MFNNKLKNIDINKIQANENQPRTVFNEEKIEELAASIKENGLIQPIVVRKVNGIYQIIAGKKISCLLFFKYETSTMYY